MSGDMNISDSSGDELLGVTKSTEPRISERGFRVRQISVITGLLPLWIEAFSRREGWEEIGKFRNQQI